MHLNAASFTAPVFSDLTMGKLTRGDWVHYFWELDVPDLTSISMTHVARIRRYLADAISQFSRATMKVLGSGHADVHSAEAMVEDLQTLATALKQEIESALARFEISARLPKTRFALGAGGQQGGVSSTVDFLLSGGTLT
jgi:hypothetical protein